MFKLPDLPYDYDALEPTISADTLHFHHDKHHKAYIEKTNTLAEKAGLSGKSLEEVVREASKTGDKTLFNNAAQAWNHAFFWPCMAPGGKSCTGQLKAAIEKTFGSVDEFKDKFVEEGVGHFGSGWVWLATGSEGLKIISTHDADDTLVKDGLFPLLVCDLWEHAYYLDYQNDRKAFLAAWLQHAANYFFAEQQMFAADGKGEGFKFGAPMASGGGGKEAPAEQPRV
ncbi:superoxide dismutase [Phenylobacterium sp.]|jgi:Fe-Mn family superoxide dismutase|uniref:superoxide dismutase n=1 Tax=Phenylobacterium sp. TaxID=1871053 RepID=UPI002F40C832